MPAPSLFLLVLTYLGLVSLGLPDTITGVVWPSVAKHFALPLGYLGTVLVASVTGVLVSSLSAGTAIQRLGVGGLLSASGALVAVSLAGEGGARGTGRAGPQFWLVPGGAVIAGLGAGAIDAGLNAYAARHFSARQMAWLHGFWGVGATLGAMAAASVWLPAWRGRRRIGFSGQRDRPLTVTFFLNRQAWQSGGSERGEAAKHETPGTMGEALRHPVVWAQMLAFYIYTGVEMSAGAGASRC